MAKRIISFVTVFMIAVFCFCTVASATADSLPGSFSGGTKGLMFIKRPETLSASTSDKTYTISASVKEGCVVKVYRKNASGGYDVIHQNGAALVSKVGASGFYSVSVVLNEGDNNLMVTADAGNGVVQEEKITIKRIGRSTLDKLSQITLNLFSMFR